MSLKNTDYNAWLAELRVELDTGHPDTGAYSNDDAVASEEINAENRQASQKVERASIRQSFLRLGPNTWNRLIDDARAQQVNETDTTPPAGATRSVLFTYERMNPFTAEFVGLFETSLSSVSEPLNMRTEPVNSLLIGMRDTDNSLSGNAVDMARELSDVLVSRSTELWGTSAEPTEGGTTQQVNEQVVTLPQDVTAARAL